MTGFSEVVMWAASPASPPSGCSSSSVTDSSSAVTQSHICGPWGIQRLSQLSLSLERNATVRSRNAREISELGGVAAVHRGGMLQLCTAASSIQLLCVSCWEIWVWPASRGVKTLSRFNSDTNTVDWYHLYTVLKDFLYHSVKERS